MNDLTGFFYAKLNVVFFNLDNGAKRWRINSIAPSK